MAATRARRRLYLSYPKNDTSGRPLIASFFLRDLRLLFEGGFAHVTERKRSDITCPLEMAAGEADLLSIAHAGLGGGTQGSNEERQAVALYERLRANGGTRQAALSLRRRPGRLTVPEALEELRRQAVQFRATALQKFAHCQFGFFAETLLEVQPGPGPKAIDPLLEGEVAHAAIEQWTRGGCGEPIESVVDRCFADKTRDIPRSHIAAKARAELIRWLRQFAGFERARSAQYRTQVRPEYIELRFGSSDARASQSVRPAEGALEASPAAEARTWPALTFEVRDESGPARVSVSGRLDRLEIGLDEGQEVALVVDFKYGKHGFDDERWAEIQTGTELQLPIYLIAASEIFGIQPGGAELHALKSDKQARCGIYDQGAGRALYGAAPPPGGKPLPHDEFAQVIQRGKEAVRRCIEAIRSGAIAVTSTDWQQCDSCAFLDLCGATRWEVERARELAVEQ